MYLSTSHDWKLCDNSVGHTKMIDTPFLDIPERTVFSEEAYGVIGRALCVAQHFESICKGLTSILDIKNNIIQGEINPLDSEDFANFVEKLLKRSLGENLIHLKKKYGFPDDISITLDEGRKARNDLAHSITLGFEHTIESDDGRNAIFEDIKDCVIKIAEADKIIAFFIQVVTNEPLPIELYFDSYVAGIVDWVCEMFDY